MFTIIYIYINIVKAELPEDVFNVHRLYIEKVVKLTTEQTAVLTNGRYKQWLFLNLLNKKIIIYSLKKLVNNQSFKKIRLDFIDIIAYHCRLVGPMAGDEELTSNDFELLEKLTMSMYGDKLVQSFYNHLDVNKPDISDVALILGKPLIY